MTEAPDVGRFLQRAQAGDASAFGEVCRVYETRLFRQAMRLCGNQTVAEDLAQDTLVEAWKSLGRFKGRCRFFTWLCAILLNRHRNTLRERRPVSFSALANHDQDEFRNEIARLTDQNALPDDAAQVRERAAQVLKCVQALPKKHQQIIYLRFYVDDSLEGIAAALGCSLGTVKSRLFRALEKLRAMKGMASNVEGPEDVATESKW